MQSLFERGVGGVCSVSRARDFDVGPGVVQLKMHGYVTTDSSAKTRAS